MTVTNQELMNAYDMLDAVSTVENTKFNFAIFKTKGSVLRRYNELKDSIGFTPEMVEFIKGKETIVAKYFKPGVKLIDAEQSERLNQEMSEYISANDHVVKSRIRQVDSYRELKRLYSEIEIHTIPLTREYIPDTISILDLFNASIVIEWDKIEVEKISIPINKNDFFQVFKVHKKIGKLFTLDPINQLEFAARMSFNLWLMYKVMMELKFTPAFIEWTDKYEGPSLQIVEKFCKKDYYGNPVKKDDKYIVENVEDYVAEMTILENQTKDIISAKNDLMTGSITLDICPIPFDWIPANLNGDIANEFFLFIKED